MRRSRAFVTRHLNISYEAGSTGTGEGQFDGANAVAVDGANIYALDTANNRIQKFK